MERPFDPTEPEPARRRALGAFVRAHRARLSPGLVGLGAGVRRRTPGLRREEVAQLAGMSATWYSWIEQGRDVAISPAALARLAQVLRLTRAERAYLFDLAGRRDPASPPETEGDAPPGVAAALATIAAPAYLLDRTSHARAWNAPAARLFTGWLDGDNDRNLLRYIFLNRQAKRFILDWAERARRVLAEFRADYSRHVDDPVMRAIVEELRRKSEDFARFWDEQIVTAREGGERRFEHPLDGFLRFEQVTLTVASRPDFKLVMLVPLHPPSSP